MTTSPPEATCPGCGQRVDPLRAGHVTVRDSGFQYFCRLSCKEEYLRTLGSAYDPNAKTAPPPAVAREPGHAPVLPVIALPARDAPSVSVASAESVASPAPPPALAPVLASTPDAWSAAPAAPPSHAARARERAVAWLDALGAAAGVLAASIGVLGPAADVFRLPLVVAACFALAVRTALSRPDPADPHWAVVIGPTAGAVLAACWAQAEQAPHALGIAVFAGLAPVSAIAVERLVARARVHVEAARERIACSLDVPVRVIQGDDTVSLPAFEVRPGEQVVALSGETVGVDAHVVAGEARVWPWPDARADVVKREGDPVVAGARVITSRLRMTTTSSGRERAWAKLLAPSSRLDVAAPTPRALRHGVERGVPAAAALGGLAAFVASAGPSEVLATMAAAATVIGSKALASFVGLHFARAHLEALANGIAFKDARAFERAGGTDIAVLCARGTVLLGEPEIVAVEPIGGAARPPESGTRAPALDAEAARVLALAAGAETASSHPFAGAILRAARMHGVKADPVRNATAHAGLGVTALASTGERLVVGGRAIMLEEKIGVARADARIAELEAQGRSVLLVAVGDRVVGLIALQDGLRAGARGAIQRLLDARIEPVLLSGEARETCETIGRALDVDHLRPEVLPGDRGAEVRALAEGGSVVAVIGHPATDDGALGAADVAVAMGAAGSTPGEWAVALASDDVRDAAEALALARATRPRVSFTVALAATPCLAGLLAIAFGIGPLAVAAIAPALGAVAAAVYARTTGGR